MSLGRQSSAWLYLEALCCLPEVKFGGIRAVILFVHALILFLNHKKKQERARRRKPDREGGPSGRETEMREPERILPRS